MSFSMHAGALARQPTEVGSVVTLYSLMGRWAVPSLSGVGARPNLLTRARPQGATSFPHQGDGERQNQAHTRRQHKVLQPSPHLNPAMLSTVDAVVDHVKGVTEVTVGGNSSTALSYVAGNGTPAAVEIVREPVEARVMHSSWEWACAT